MPKKIVKTEDYCGEDRRGIKIGKDLWYRIGYALLIGAMVIGVYKVRIEAMETEQKIQASELKEQKEKIIITENKIGKIETEIPNIKESIQRIETSQIETQKDIKLLLQKIQ